MWAQDEGEEEVVLVAFSVTPLGIGEDVGRVVAEGADIRPSVEDAMTSKVEDLERYLSQ